MLLNYVHPTIWSKGLREQRFVEDVKSAKSFTSRTSYAAVAITGPQTHAHDLQVTRTRERIKRQHPEYRAKVNAQSRTWRQNPVNKAKVNKQRRKVAKLKRRIRRAVRKGQIMLYKPLSLVYVRPTLTL